MTIAPRWPTASPPGTTSPGRRKPPEPRTPRAPEPPSALFSLHLKQVDKAVKPSLGRSSQSTPATGSRQHRRPLRWSAGRLMGRIAARSASQAAQALRRRWDSTVVDILGCRRSPCQSSGRHRRPNHPARRRLTSEKRCCLLPGARHAPIGQAANGPRPPRRTARPGRSGRRPAASPGRRRRHPAPGHRPPSRATRGARSGAPTRRRPRAATRAGSGHCQLEQSEGDFRRFASAIHQVACDV